MSLATIPDGARSLAGIGDTHIGLNSSLRYNRAQEAWNIETPTLPQMRLLLHIGDLVEGDSETLGDLTGIEAQEAVSVPWFDGFRATRSKRIPGNHDMDRPGADTDAKIADWEAVNGEPAKEIIDTEFFRLITPYAPGGGTSFSAAQDQAFVEDAIANSALPVVLAMHYMFRDTHHDNNIQGTHTAVFNSMAPTYTGVVNTTSDTFVKDLAVQYPQLKLILGGHSHLHWDTIDFIKEWPAGSGREPVIFCNLGAITYVAAALDVWADPIVFPVFTFEDDALEIRLREVAAQRWLARNGRDRVERFLFQ